MSTTLASPQSPASAVPFVKQTRIIRAVRQAVYDAWTKPEPFSKWWVPPITSSQASCSMRAREASFGSPMTRCPTPPCRPASRAP